MIYRDGSCSECKRFHPPARDHKDDCPEQPRIFFSREARQHYLERKEMETRHAIEARERRKADEADELNRGKTKALSTEVLDEYRQAKYAAAREAYTEGVAGYHEYQEAQKAAQRLLRNQRVREREGR